MTIRLNDIADRDRMNAARDGWIDRAAMPVPATFESRPIGEGCRADTAVTAAA